MSGTPTGATPVPTGPRRAANRAGLERIQYRLGTHGEFLARMLDALPEQVVPHPQSGAERRPLAGLISREPGDPSIALLDGWSVVADVLTFYQERIANEGFIRTATERRSMVEMARSLAHVPDPGVAAATYLAFSVEATPGTGDRITIPARTGVRSVPGQGEQPQTFETVADFEALPEWNAMPVLVTRRTLAPLVEGTGEIHLAGTSTRLQPGDTLLMVGEERIEDRYREQWEFRFIRDVEPDSTAGVTRVTFTEPIGHSRVAEAPYPTVYALRLRTAMFGQDAPDWQGLSDDTRARALIDPGLSVTGLALLADGRIVSAGEDEQLLQWALDRDTAIHTMRREDERLAALAATPASRQVWSELGVTTTDDPQVQDAEEQERDLVATGSESGEIQFWDVAYRSCVAQAPPTGGEAVTDIALSPWGAYALACYADGFLRTWRVHAEPERVASVGAHEPGHTVVATLPGDGANFWALTGGVEGVARLWAVHEGEPRECSFEIGVEAAEGLDHGTPIGAVAMAYSPTTGHLPGAFMLTGGMDGLIRLWGFNMANAVPASGSPEYEGVFILAYEGHGMPVTGLAVNPALNLVASCSEDGTLKLWRLPSADLPNDVDITLPYGTFGGHAGGVNRVIFGARGRLLVSAAKDGTVRLWTWEHDSELDAAVPREIRALRGHGRSRRFREWPGLGLVPPGPAVRQKFRDPDARAASAGLAVDQIDLKAHYPRILAESWVVLRRSPITPRGRGCAELYGVRHVTSLEREAFGAKGKVSRLTLSGERLWFIYGRRPQSYRNTEVYAESEALERAEVDVPLPRQLTGTQIELQRIVPDFEPGHLLVVRGRRLRLRIDSAVLPVALESADGTRSLDLAADETLIAMAPPERVAPSRDRWTLQHVTGFVGAIELAATDFETYAMAAPALPDDPVVSEMAVVAGTGHDAAHHVITIAEPLREIYDRASTKVLANVVTATHGQTVEEVLGSGDASQAVQRFALRQSPLTYEPATTDTGSRSSLEVRVNGVLWEETPSPLDAGPDDPQYLLRIDDDDRTVLAFGEDAGARLPTGADNVTARYRIGLGLTGEVRAETLTLLQQKPLGVTAVTNPIAASGAGDRESASDLRETVPASVVALGRVVALGDVEPFARRIPGVGKAQLTTFWEGERRIAFVTVTPSAGACDPQSPLMTRLRGVFTASAEPAFDIELGCFRQAWFGIAATVRRDPAYEWEPVRSALETQLRDAFSLERRNLAQAVTLAEVMAEVHRVAGVVAVDVNRLHRVEEPTELGESIWPDEEAVEARIPAARAVLTAGGIAAAELLLLHPAALDLKEMPA